MSVFLPTSSYEGVTNRNEKTVLYSLNVELLPLPPEIPFSERGFSVVSVSYTYHRHKIVLVGFKATDPLLGFTFCMLLSISS